jgi:DNA recombination protein Rad52
MFDWNEKASLLNAKLDPKHVKPPLEYGPKGDYIEGWWAIAEANRIFGHGGWSYDITKLKCVAEAPREIGRYKKPGFGVTYTARVEVFVDNVRREDVGAGHGYDVDCGLAHESAIKEAVTDALKRTLRTFGNPFGLALYDKTKANVGVDAPARALGSRDTVRDSVGYEPPHDPVTGEMREDDHGAPVPSGTGLSGFMDIIKEQVGPNATRDDISHAYAVAVLDKVNAYKPNKRGEPWLEQFAQTHEPAISRLKASLQATVREGFAKKRASINDPKFDPRDFEPIGIEERMVAEGTFGG